MKTITRVFALALVVAFNLMTSVLAQPYTYHFQRTRGIAIEVMTPEAFNETFGNNPDVPREDAAIIALAERLFPPQGQPRPSRGWVGQSISYEVGVLFAALKNPAIDPATRETVDSIIASSEPSLPKTYTSGHFRFFYTDSDPDPRNNATLTQIKKTALALNASWTSYSSNFRTPKHYLAGSKQMLDIKVYWLGDDMGVTNRNWDYIALNSQETVANDCMSKITAAHELFHRVQFAYRLENITPNMKWLVEGSATWSEKYRHASIKDYMNFMNKGLTTTDPSIGFMQRDYDTVHFWVYLEKRWGWAAIKEVWETFETNGHDAKAAVDAMLHDKNRNSSFDQFVGEWALTNYVKDTANPGVNDYDEDEIRRTSCGVPYGPLRHVPRRGKALIKT